MDIRPPHAGWTCVVMRMAWRKDKAILLGQILRTSGRRPPQGRAQFSLATQNAIVPFSGMRTAGQNLFALGVVLASLSCYTPKAAAADSSTETTRPGQKIELHLANGDRLTGELVWRADGKIRFRSPLLGDITVAETDAAILELPESLDPATAAQGDTAKAPATASAKPASAPAVAAVRPSPDNPAGTKPSAGPAKETWKGKVEFGSVQQTGRTDTLSYNVRAEAEKNVRRHTLRATGRVLYAKQNDRPSADRQDAAFRWRYQLSKRTFAQAQTTYYADKIIQIQTNVEQNAGLGYRIIDEPRHVVNLGGGVTAQYREWDAGTNGWAPYADVFQDYTFKINDRISFIQDAIFQYSPSDRAFNIPNRSSPKLVSPDEQNYKMRFNSTLQGKVTERISLNLRFEYELDNAIQLQDARETQRITSSIGYAF